MRTTYNLGCLLLLGTFLLLAFSFACTPTTPPASSDATVESIPEQSSTDSPAKPYIAPLLNNADGKQSLWNAVAHWRGVSQCSSSLVKTSDKPTAPAYLLTNAHCLNIPARAKWSNHIIRNQTFDTTATAVFRYFVDTTDKQVTTTGKQVAYATMKGTDLAIVELKETLGELAKKGVQALPLADKLPATDVPIAIVGIPQSGVPSGEVFVRRTDCKHLYTTHVFEEIWHFLDVAANRCKGVAAGSSGSPVWDAQQKAVFGVLSTRAQGISPCALNSPCEWGQGALLYKHGTNYVVPVVGLKRCFDEDGKFSPTHNGCSLDTEPQFSVTTLPPLPTRPPRQQPDKAPGWNVALEGDAKLTHLRFKAGLASKTDCRDLKGYSTPLPVKEQPLLKLAMGTKHGSYVLCVLAGEGKATTSRWQSVKHPTQVVGQIDLRPPTAKPLLQVVRERGLLTLDLFTSPPELNSYLVKLGEPSVTDCGQSDGYKEFQAPIVMPEKRLPVALCVIARDKVGNAGKPWRWEWK